MTQGHLSQDPFLEKLLQEKTTVSIFLVNGIKLHGTIDGYDAHVVFLKNVVTQMIYKHAISTVVPGEVVKNSQPAA